MPRDTLIQVRRDTLTNWSTVNPILASGEPGLETTTNRTKVGDGTTAWNSLIYQNVPFYGSFYSTATITGSTTISGTGYSYLGTSFQTDVSHGVSITGSVNNLITFQYAGVYNVQFSAQFDNTDSEDQDINIWIEKNAVGSFIANSNSRVTVPKRKPNSGPFGRVLPSWDFIVQVNAGDWIRFVWSARDHATGLSVSTTRLASYSAETSPIEIPATPSVIITVQQLK